MESTGVPWPLDSLARRTYEHCLRHGRRSIEQLERALEADRHALMQAVGQLTAVGLVQHPPPGPPEGSTAAHADVEVVPPRTALYGAALSLEDAAEGLRHQAQEWDQLWRRHRDRADYVEILTEVESIDAVRQVSLQQVRHSVCGLQVGAVGSVGPAGLGTAVDSTALRPGTLLSPGFLSAIDRGVGFQVVYGVSVLRDPGQLAAVQACVALGQLARVFADVPLSIAIYDQTLAMIAVPGLAETRRHVIVVHASGFLDSLIEQFDSYWRMGIPLADAGDSVGGDGPDDQSRALLAHLNAGMTDDAIARELGVSERTVGRRVARLEERLGARSRFQLAAQAYRRGWL
ncbi:helix-turn-helix transcriptional regulator [Knoellia sinensis]|uniref:helix-turn-helix transcriptional regulator n=1 Tax=Knoellia sinensis TaxID=136100 RepID=UPI0006908716|nr:helix-turn-helix transcriptional regulator [Knoellia sinensis]